MMDLSTFSRLSDEAYYQAPILSKSSLYNFKADISEERSFIKAGPQTLRIGQLFHLAVYEPAKYLQQPEYRLPEMAKELNMLARMAIAARSNALVASFLNSKLVAFEKPVAGYVGKSLMKAKPDAGIFVKNGLGHDAKSTACRSLEEFIQSCIDYRYFSQAFIYMTVCGFKSFYFTGVSKAEIQGRHQVYTIDVSRLKTPMKEAKEEVLALLELHHQIIPTYQNKSFNYINSLSNGQA